jgi:acyl-CoA synthetase (AMP-forming)/AMP-acid ligase II
MSDPLAFLPLTLAAANGRIDGLETRRLVAAGVALLQRTAPLVRALHGRRSAILLPAGAPFVTALGASEGRVAMPLDPAASPATIADAIAQGEVGAVFTCEALAPNVPATVPRVLLDETPERARWVGSDGLVREVALTTHAGLHLEGDVDVDGADEAVVVLGRWEASGAAPKAVSHRALLAGARTVAREARLSWRDHTLTLVPCADPVGLVVGLVAPLLAGGRVSTRPADDAPSLLADLEHTGVSMLVAPSATYAALADALATEGRHLDAPVLQRCVVDSAGTNDDVRARWQARTGLTLLDGPTAW